MCINKLINDKYLIAVVCSFVIMVISRNFLAERYRSEIKLLDTTEETIRVIGKSSGAFFFEDNKEIVYKPIETDEDHNDNEKIHVHGPECKGLPGHEHHEDEDKSHNSIKIHVHGPECKGLPGHENHEEQGEESKISPGLALMMKQLGFAEMAASFLWIQMDADSHKELWHRVDFELELIPALDPTFIEGFLLRSFILSRYRNDWKGAVYIIEKALKQLPNRIELWEQLGLLCFNFRGRYGNEQNIKRAQEAYAKAASLPESYSYNARYYVQTLSAEGKQEEAIATMKKLLADEERQKDEFTHKQDLDLLKRLENGETFKGFRHKYNKQ